MKSKKDTTKLSYYIFLSNLEGRMKIIKSIPPSTKFRAMHGIVLVIKKY